MSTTTTLAASSAGLTVTLAAAVTGTDGTVPAGSVQFQVASTAIGSPVPVSSAGLAAATTTFAAPGAQSFTAVFTPASTTAYSGSTSAAVTLTVQAGTSTGTEPLAVAVPATGAFTLTVGTGTVTLTVSGSSATGVLNPVTVSDTRNTYPGWSVSGQMSDFAGTGAVFIPGSQLGWTPTSTSLATGVTLGGPVAPGGPGLASAAVLAQAHSGGGFGTSVLDANLTLAIPPTAVAGSYAGTLTVTAVTSLP